MSVPILWNEENLAILFENASQIIVITDRTVGKYYAALFMQSLKSFQTRLLLVKPGESSKSRRVKAKLEEQLLAWHCDRQSVIVALGGGVISDLAGFVAATYLRGIAYINIPTTLLAMVDSSVGGKVAINTRQGKNLIGSFWPPKAIIMNFSYLNTLPKSHWISGSVEALKVFLTSDAQTFSYFCEEIPAFFSENLVVVEKIIRAAILIKTQIVAADPFEKGLRKVLNFGHTLGHAIEVVSRYQMLHGIAVGYGILIESQLSVLMGFLSEEEALKIREVLLQLGISGDFLKKFKLTKIIAATFLDKKNERGEIQVVLLKKIGQFHQDQEKFTHSISVELLTTAWNAVLEGASNGGK